MLNRKLCERAKYLSDLWLIWRYHFFLFLYRVLDKFANRNQHTVFHCKFVRKRNPNVYTNIFVASNCVQNIFHNLIIIFKETVQKQTPWRQKEAQTYKYAQGTTQFTISVF